MKNILCIGGSGQLGNKVLNCMKGYNLINIDYSVSPIAQQNISMDSALSASQNNLKALRNIEQHKLNYDAMIVTAGGWTGGSIKDDDYNEKWLQMMQMNLSPSMLAAHLSTKYLNDKGLLIFTGAAAVFKEAQPEMVAYALSKTAVHSLAMTMAKKIDKATVITILPDVIDTETNRKAMPNADFSKWANPQKIGQLMRGWVDGYNVPSSGSFALLQAKNDSIITRFV